MTTSREPLVAQMATQARPRAAPLERTATLFSHLADRRGATLAACLALVLVIGVVDVATGYEFALSLLYVVPIFACTWVFGVRAGLAFAALATLAWLATDILAGHEYSHPGYRYWEMLIKLSTFALFTVILGELKRALERSDDRLITVLEGLDAAVFVLDPAADAILYRNRHFAPVFAGRHRIETARDAQRLLGIDGLTGHLADDGAALHIGERWFLVRTRDLTWTDGRPVLLVTATDITDRRLAEESSRAQRERLLATARLVAVGEIASSIAHELNQPLAAITGYLSGSLRRLRAGRAEPAAIAGALEEANRQAERAGEIIRRVRDFVRTRETALVAMDLNEAVAKAARFAVPDAERLGVRIELELAAALPPGRADPVMLEQVVINLVRNAIEAMTETPPDRRVVQIATTLIDGGVLEVAVADAGPGLAPEVAARLFEPFFTTKPEGTGLGLNICRSIVEFHGGRLSTAASRLGGSLFRFTVRSATGDT